MKRRIGVDCDGVLNYLHKDLMVWLPLNYGKFSLNEETYVFNTFEEMFSMSIPEIKTLLQKYYESDYYVNTKPTKHSIEVLSNLTKNNDFHLITARHKEAKPYTLNWINKNFPNIFKSINHIDNGGYNSKADACKDLGIDYMIEDAHYQINHLDKEGIKTILYSGAYSEGVAKKLLNMMPERTIHARSWKDIEKILKKEK